VLASTFSFNTCHLLMGTRNRGKLLKCTACFREYCSVQHSRKTKSMAYISTVIEQVSSVVQ